MFNALYQYVEKKVDRQVGCDVTGHRLLLRLNSLAGSKVEVVNI
jgi:hypothetical protein